MAEEPWDARWGRAAIRLVRTPSGWIHVHLGNWGGGWLNQFDQQGRLVQTEQVWWDEERHPRSLDVDLASGLISMGLERRDAEAITAGLRADVKPLQLPHSRLHALKIYATLFAWAIGGWVLAFALLIWILVTQVF